MYSVFVSDELEGVRYHLYSELSDTKKEMRNDLQYWKKWAIFMIIKESEGICTDSLIMRTIDSESDQSMCAWSHHYINEKCTCNLVIAIPLKVDLCRYKYL